MAANEKLYLSERFAAYPSGMSEIVASRPVMEGVNASSAATSALRRAGGRTGVSFSYLVELARRESGFDPKAQSRTSSAAGMFQFIEQTWLATVKKHGAQFGLGAYADEISKAGGKWVAKSPEALKRVLDLRFDIDASAAMAAASTDDNRLALKTALGREPAEKELYLAHFLGARGATKLICADPSADAAALFPEAAKANASIFYKDGRARSCAELFATLTSKFAGATTSGESVPQKSPSPRAAPPLATFSTPRIGAPAHWTNWAPPALSFDILNIISPDPSPEASKERNRRP